MMCRDMAEELAHFDLQKEKELKQVLLEYTAAQLERHEKVHGTVTVACATVLHVHRREEL